MGVAAEEKTARATGTVFASTHTPLSCSRVKENGLARTRSVEVMMTRGERVMRSCTLAPRNSSSSKYSTSRSLRLTSGLASRPQFTGASTLRHRSFSVSWLRKRGA